MTLRFIWVKYQIDKICDEITPADVEKALTELPDDLNQMYAKILETIRTRHPSTRRFANAERALKWVLYAVKPLSPEALIEAISLTGALDRRQPLTLPTLLDICHNLIVLDQQLGILRFAHFSVHEFLRDKYSVEEGNAGLANDCLTVLTDSDTGQITQSKRPSFVDYACVNWPEHFRLSGGGSRELQDLCKYFLTPSSAYQAWISKVSSENRLLIGRGHETLPPLIAAFYYQLPLIREELLDSLQKREQLNCVNTYRFTVLHLAARVGDENAVQMLLEKKEVDVNSKDDGGKTPLWLAAEKGHERVLQRLLGKNEVEVNNKDTNYGRTALVCAVQHNRGGGSAGAAREREG